MPPLRAAGVALWMAVSVLSGACSPPREIPLLNGLEPVEIELDGVRKSAVSRRFSEPLDLEVEVPARAELAVSFAVQSPKPVPRARTRFRIHVLADGRAIEVFERTLRLHEHNRWHEVTVNLAAWRGQRVTLRFNTEAGSDAPVPWADRIRVAWGNPSLAIREPVFTPVTPSVIMIVIDTLRYDYLGLHGFQGDISPHLDWLGLESLRFEGAMAPAPWTKPSVASLFTGLYPDTHGVLDEAGHINPDATDTLSPQAETLAEVLRGQGFDTVAFVGNSWLAADYGFSQGFDSYFVGHRDDALVARAREWLRSRDGRKPYFLYIHLIGVHGPYQAPERDYAALKDSPSLGPDRRIRLSDPSRPEYLEATPFLDDDEREHIRAWRGKYAATVRKTDRMLGELINELRSNGELDRSFVVFTSDHGEEFLEHASWVHGYELCGHQLHVPLWIREPAAVSAGRRLDRVVSLVDVLPTLLSRLSIPVPDSVQGEDRYPASDSLNGTTQPAPDASALATGVLGRPNLYALRTARHHLIWDADSGNVSLYDLTEDPRETRDVASDNPDAASSLERKLVEQLAVIERAGRLEGEETIIPDELRERLRALGYIH